MTYLIISGGTVEQQVMQNTLSAYSFDGIIAVDKGIEACHMLGIQPNLVVGDFDSADDKIVRMYKTCCDFITLNPHKDDTDTEYAITYAIEHDASRIILLGATGTRYDHVISNVGLLKKCVDKEIEAYIIDAHNRISMINRDTRVFKSEYPYISLLPYDGAVYHVALKGFEYDGEDICLESGTSLGVSNSILSDYADITMKDGYLILFETKD
ncbi:MAG: thiamine diphosphokinase [Coprococcus sp.]|nr:thiamine diphosphokinase [Coprococcus sp.]